MDNIDKILYKNIPTDELYHFGILGMKWGKRNGPPYPLGPDKSTGKRLKTKGEKKEKDKKKPRSDQRIKPKYDYEKDEYGWLNKDLDVSGSNGKPTKLHAMIDTETYDYNTKQYRQLSDNEIKDVKDRINNFAKDFKTYDKIAREAIREDMRDYLPGWGNGKTSPDTFMKNLQDPAVRIITDFDEAVLEYTSPHTYHFHSVEIDLKTKKVCGVSMDG